MSLGRSSWWQSWLCSLGLLFGGEEVAAGGDDKGVLPVLASIIGWLVVIAVVAVAVAGIGTAIYVVLHLGIVE